MGSHTKKYSNRTLKGSKRGEGFPSSQGNRVESNYDRLSGRYPDIATAKVSFSTNIEELEAKLRHAFQHYVIENTIVDEPIYAEPEFPDQYRLVIRQSRKTHKYCDGMVSSNNRNYATVDLVKNNEDKKVIQSFRVDVNNTCKQGEITANGADKIKLYNTATLIQKIRERVFYENIQDLQGELTNKFDDCQVINKIQSMNTSIDKKKIYRIEIRKSTTNDDIKELYCANMQDEGYATVDLVYVPQENKEKNKELYIRSFRVDLKNMCDNTKISKGKVMFYNIKNLIKEIELRIKHNDNIQHLKTILIPKFPNIEVDYIITDAFQPVISTSINKYKANTIRKSYNAIEIRDYLVNAQKHKQNCEIKDYSGYASVYLLNKTDKNMEELVGFNVDIKNSCQNTKTKNNNEGRFYNIDDLIKEIENKLNNSEDTHMEVDTNGEDTNNTGIYFETNGNHNNGGIYFNGGGGSRKTKKHRKKSKSKKQSNKKNKSH